MTTPFSASSPGNRAKFDTGPLSWVMGEIREALAQSKRALFDAVAKDAESQSTSLRHAKTYLHQAHGALQIVDVDGVALITETIEDLIDRLEAGQLPVSERITQAIERAYQALVEYLEDLLSGAQPQPVMLFPYYRALLEVRGAERIHPADLFFPNLALRPQLPPRAAAAPVDYAGLRKRFEKALLGLLIKTNPDAERNNTAAISDIIAEIERAQNLQQTREFWWVMHGFSDAVGAAQAQNDLYVKQLLGRINLQIRRLVDGSPSISERLQRDALFFIARVGVPTPLSQQIRRAYQLDGLVPVDYETQRYGQIDVDALAQAKEALAQAKNLWSRIAGGDVSVTNAFEAEMKTLAESSVKLNSPSLAKLLRELNGIARHARSDSRLGLQIAASLLFIENALDQINRLSDEFPERADALTARLLSIAAGETPQESAPWIDELARQAQQRQTMTVLAGEMKTSLRQVEKLLDGYFSDATKRDALIAIDPILHQIGGALAILEQDDALHAVQHTRAAVQRFVQPTGVVGAEGGGDGPVAEAALDLQVLQHVAQNIGALGFFIEMLPQQPDTAKSRFSFDHEQGIFRANLLEKNKAVSTINEGDASAPLLPAVDAASDLTDAGPRAAHPQSEPPVASVPTVEDELARHQRKSADLALSLAAEPDNCALQLQLKESLTQVCLDAALLDNSEATDRAQAAIDILERPDFSTSHNTVADIVTATAPVATAVESVAQVVTPATEEAIDAELLEIFMMEAEEVLAFVKQTVPQSRADISNQEHLTTLRRSFHTLKGSGRMVGLNAFADASGSIEQVMNLWLAEARAGTPDLYSLLDTAQEQLSAWVCEINLDGNSSRSPTALKNAAESVKQGQTFHFDEAATAPVAAAAPETPAAAAAPEVEQIDPLLESQIAVSGAPATDVDTDMQVIPDQQGFAVADAYIDLTADESIEMVEPIEPIDSNEAFDSMELIGPVELIERGDSIESIESIAAQPALTGEPDHPTSDVSTTIGQVDSAPDDGMFDGMQDDSDIVPISDFVLSEESEPSTPAAVEPVGACEPPAVAEIIDFPGHIPRQDKPDDNIKQIGELEISVPLYNIYLAETDEIVRLLAQDFAEWRHEPHRHVSIQAVHAAHSLAGSSATVGFQSLQQVAHGLEMVLQSLTRRHVNLHPDEYDTLEQCVDHLKLMLQKFAVGEMSPYEPELVRQLAQLQDDVVARAAMKPLATQQAEFDAAAIAALNDAKQAAQQETAQAALPETQSDVTLEPESATEPAAESRIVLPLFVPPQAPLLPTAVFPIAADALTSGQAEQLIDPALAPKDDLDADLLPVFLEEGNDLLPRIGEALRAWQNNLGDKRSSQAVLRLLHTVKGSARMAGAMGLGQHAHEMESRIENIVHAGPASAQALEGLLARHDQCMYLFDALQNPDAVKAAQQQTAVATPDDATGGTAIVRAAQNYAVPVVAATTGAPAAAQVPLVRVRADILDRLVNQAGEVSISRSKLETEVGTLRQSLSELTENMARLRGQLREVEIQAETQITSRMSHNNDREFDPLEFDRFSRLQELTRMMAESVNDVASVQDSLVRTVDGATADLLTQARLTRDLQQDLMRVRMVPFASISERLYRVARQTSKEVDKRVSLDIRGTAVEIDRGVLEKMTGPFEHLLRNAIVHGIETRAARQAVGKSETGELLVEIRQEGNEVVIQFTDDGQGLNLERIRAKARAVGLLTDEREVSDAETADIIFQPGFSTAQEVTELAGRGVGMDVVRSEAAALGGRVAITTEAGKGAHFTIHLPLTLAVTQVVLLSTGGTTYAVPSVLVEQVQQLKINPLASAYNDGAIVWQGNRVPLHYLSALLGDLSSTPVAQQYSPIVILKSGNERVAIHVDEVIGNKEVVVKNIGPQLARMIGIAGATVLGSGDIVLIVNPVPLAQRVALDNLRAARIMASDAPTQMGAVANLAPATAMPATGPQQPALSGADAVQGLRKKHIVMVVDDSLTVRRVTQRFLQREGYQVVLAKDGVDALEHLQSITPDVMLVDIEMPRMDGFDLTRNVRGDERSSHIPIIMITSRTADKHRNYAMELGVNEYVGKPFQESELLKMIAGFVGREAMLS